MRIQGLGQDAILIKKAVESPDGLMFADTLYIWDNGTMYGVTCAQYGSVSGMEPTFNGVLSGVRFK